MGVPGINTSKISRPAIKKRHDPERFDTNCMYAQNTLKSFRHISIQIKCLSTWKFNEEHN